MSVGVYAGLFSIGSGSGYAFYTAPSFDVIVQQWRDNLNTPLCLTSIDTHQDNAATTWYTGVWTETSSTSKSLWRIADWSSFMDVHRQATPTSRLLDFDIGSSGGRRYYTGTWGNTPIRQQIVHDVSFDEFVRQWQTLSNQGMRLSKVQLYPTATTGQYHMTGVFDRADNPNEGYAFYVMTNWNDFYNEYLRRKPTMRLVDYQVYDDDNGNRFYAGVWRQLPDSALQQFIFDLDYDSFVNQWRTLSNQGYRLQKAIRYSKTVRVPQPAWASYISQNLGVAAQGYTFAIMKNGQVVSSGASGAARNAHDIPYTAWKPSTRLSIASISKTVAGVAVLKLLNDRGISIDKPFYPYMRSQIPQVGPGVDKVTIRQLLDMTSGMDDTLQAIWFPNYWDTLKTYLRSRNIPPNTSGRVYQYSNTNFLILQALVDCLIGNDGTQPTRYPDYVATNIFKPMGINTDIFTTHMDPQARATFFYTNTRSSTEAGIFWPDINNTGSGGWVSDAKELSKFLIGIRKNIVLNPSITDAMLSGNLGWDATIYEGLYGRYFHKNGILRSGDGKGLRTGIVRLSHGYDALILSNSYGLIDPVDVIIQAFEAGGGSLGVLAGEESPVLSEQSLDHGRRRDEKRGDEILVDGSMAERHACVSSTSVGTDGRIAEIWTGVVINGRRVLSKFAFGMW